MFLLPQNVKTINDEFEKSGYEAYAVGGCVRDTLLNKEPKDWDITTSATPEQMKQIFKKTIDTGIQHGTVTVRMGGESYEVTTYRIDGEYEDGRHPKQVQFTSNLREDLRRRDFTINAMAYSDNAGLVDLFEGEKDLAEKRIRAVGDPTERFTEDALRMLRAVRFAAQLGFTIEEETKNAIKKLAPNLKMVSKERIHTEFIKMLSSPHPELISVCYETGLLAQFFAELDEAITQMGMAATEKMLEVLRRCKPDKDLRLCLLFDFCSWGKEGCSEYASQLALKVLRGLKLDGNTIRRTAHIAKFLRIEPENNPTQQRKYFSVVGAEYGDDVVYMKKIIYEMQQNLPLSEEWEKIKQNNYCIAIKDLAITGADLLLLGVSQGKEVGAYLNAALDEVLRAPQNNTKDYLIEFVQGKKENGF